MNKELAKYRENIFSKIKRFFANIFFKKNNIVDNHEMLDNTQNVKNNKDFNKDILVEENEEEKRLKKLKKLYDNKELDEEKLSDEDIDKLIEMYDKEIEELRNDTERRKKNISNMIKINKSQIY